MKKIVILLSFIIIICILGILYHGYFFLPNKIDCIDIIINETEKEVSTLEYDSFIKIITKAKKSEAIDLSDFKFFTINYNLKNGEKINYKIYFNFNDNTINYYKNTTMYTLNPDLSFFFFLHEDFDFIYTKTVPKFNMYLNRDLLHFNHLETNIIYKKVDNQEYTENISFISDTENLININTNSNLSFDTNMNIINLKIRDINNKIIYENIIDDEIFIPKTSGKYFYEFILSSNNNSTIQAIYYNFIIDNPIEFIFNKNKISQGDFLSIKVINAEKEDNILLENPFYDKFVFYSENNYLIGYIPITSVVKPSEYIIKYGIDNNSLEEYEIEVINRDFRIQNLYINSSTISSTSNNEAYQEYYKYFYPARDTSNNNKIYNNNFILPVNGKVTTEYGEQRYINDKKTSYAHAGIDIAAPTGTNVKASNSGNVTLSRDLALTGKTIIIDHGQGLFSFYQHLDELFVDADVFVDRGEVIGTVGSTGRSTGAHLHFAISFHNKYIEPGYLIYNEPITKNNFEILFNK